MIYLDNAATTFPKPNQVLYAVDYCQRNYAVNVGRGSYSLASYAASIVEETRILMAELVNAKKPSDVVFTPSATIAANEIIMGLPWDQFKTVYVTPFEHNAIARPLNRISKKYGIDIKTIPFNAPAQDWDEEGTKLLFEKNPPDYVFINHVSNVTGVILPIREIANLAKEKGACVIVDAAQSLGLIEIDIQKDKIDYLIFAGHKNLYSSWGIGGFIANNNIIDPVLCGGTGSDSLNLSMASDFPHGYEPGSPNIIAISSLQASLKWLKSVGINTIATKKEQLMQRLISKLETPKVRMYLPGNMNQHTSVLSFNIRDYEPNEVGFILSQDYDIAVRTGYHCAPFIHKFLDTERLMGTVRVSVGYFNTEEDVDTLACAIADL